MQLIPQPGDVVIIHGHNFMVREISGGYARIAAGRTDAGFWANTDALIVVYREGTTIQSD